MDLLWLYHWGVRIYWWKSKVVININNFESEFNWIESWRWTVLSVPISITKEHLNDRYQISTLQKRTILHVFEKNFQNKSIVLPEPVWEHIKSHPSMFMGIKYFCTESTAKVELSCAGEQSRYSSARYQLAFALSLDVFGMVYECVHCAIFCPCPFVSVVTARSKLRFRRNIG